LAATDVAGIDYGLLIMAADAATQVSNLQRT